MTQSEAKQQALARHPECHYAEVKNGLSWNWQFTWVVELWRDEKCWAAGDPPRHVVEGFPVNG